MTRRRVQPTEPERFISGFGITVTCGVGDALLLWLYLALTHLKPQPPAICGGGVVVAGVVYTGSWLYALIGAWTGSER